MRTRGEGVKNPENFADVLYEWSLEEVAAQRAADAAVVQLHHLGLLLHQLVLLDLLRVDVDAPCSSKQ